jgi:hypothetical protein
MVRMGVLPSTTGVTALGVFSMVSLPLLSATSHAQPEPNWVAPAALNWVCWVLGGGGVVGAGREG